MRTSERPLSTLMRLVRTEASGELICAADSLEIHVFLQRGKVAWCIESGKPFAFTQRLFELTELDRDGFRHIIDECRRDRLPLGETLIRWGVASLEQVRAALRRQIVEALAALAVQYEAQVIFLERSRAFAEYDTALTFELDDVLAEVRKASGEADSLTGDGEVANGDAALVTRVASQLGGVRWCKVVGGGGGVARAPEGAPRDGLVRSLAERTIDDGADLVAVRTALGTIFGAALDAPGTSMWCGLDLDVTVGSAISRLMAQLYLEDRLPSTSRREVGPSGGAAGSCFDIRDPSGGSGDAISGEGERETEAIVRAFLAQARDVLGAFVVDADGRLEAWATRGAVDRPAMWRMCERRRPILDEVELVDVFREGDGAADLGPLQTTMVTGEGDWWCFAAQVAGDGSGTLWLFMERSSSQGLGWSYALTLGRQLAQRALS